MRAVATSIVAWLVTVGCGDCGGGPGPCQPGSGLPESWVLESDAIRVEIERAPYSVRVLDGAGTELLRSVEGAEGGEDGAMPLVTTESVVRWRGDPLNASWSAPNIEALAWSGGWVATRAESSGDDVLDVTLGRADCRAGTLHAIHQIAPGRLRVDLSSESEATTGLALAFVDDSTDAFFGFGERSNAVNQRGVEVFNWSQEIWWGAAEGEPASPDKPFPHGPAMSHFPVPFFMSSRGYGFWLDTPAWSRFRLATADTSVWRAEVLSRLVGYEVYAPDRSSAVPWPKQVLSAFTGRAGRPVVPPDWALGPRRRMDPGGVEGSDGLDGEDELLWMREQDLAITGADDATHFLPDAKQEQEGVADARRAWVDVAHALGCNVTGYYLPHVVLADAAEGKPVLQDAIEEGLEHGYVLTDAWGEAATVAIGSGGGGGLRHAYSVDFTAPGAAAWFASMVDWGLDLGYDGFMADFGEFVSPDARASDGSDGSTLHNRYPGLYLSALYDHLVDERGEGEAFFFARAGYAGTAAFTPAVWNGDPDASFDTVYGLPASVRAGINIGLSGVAMWGSDIGGYHCERDGASAANGELLTRWIEFGAFTPSMQEQNRCSGGDAKATIHDSPALEAWSYYARLHTRLFPYLRELLREAHETGIPVIRHPFLEHPDETALLEVEDTYYFGPAILVAPVVERGASTRDVVFPEASFLDWDERQIYEGGATITVDAPLERIPVFLRDGFLVPLLDPTIDTLAPESDDAIVGLTDVEDVYDVVGFVTEATGGAELSLTDGGELSVEYDGTYAAPDLTPAADEDDLADCPDGCWLAEDFGDGRDGRDGRDGLLRWRVSLAAGAPALSAGGVTLHSTSSRRIRWDLYLVTRTT